MKLSVVIICWNDLNVIIDCLQSVYQETTSLEFEIIVSDNGSTDDSVERIRREFPEVRIVENGANLGFARGNNAGIRVVKGQYVLILNPDTIIRDRALEKLVAFADRHLEAGAFGCRVLNPDGSDQHPAMPLPSLMHSLKTVFVLGGYHGWDGNSEREIGRQSGCCILVRSDVLTDLNGFDEQFFYHYEETDLCCRIWKHGLKVLFCPEAEITHLGGQSVGRFPIRFVLETYRSQYRYFYKHLGHKGVRRCRWILLLHLGLRRLAYGLVALVRSNETLRKRMEMYRVTVQWNWRLDPRRFVETGEEPDLGYKPMAPAPKPVPGASA